MTTTPIHAFGIDGAVVKSAVSNQQVAPTIIRALGLDPNDLEAARKEQIGIAVLVQRQSR